MKFVSTTGKSKTFTFREAVLGNLPDDGGLFFPSTIPKLDRKFIKNLDKLTLSEVALQVLSPFCEATIARSSLQRIVEKVFDFPMPLVHVSNEIHCLELFHGPTYAFKDIGAKFLAECLSYFRAYDSKETTVLVATSGDTGGAVANGFLDVEGVRVIILYPKDRVSDLQEKQLTTLGRNITALEVTGTFDDCQNMVKQAFADLDLKDSMQLSSANSINIARWLPQSLFYFVPAMNGFEDVTISVPSGNYGNLTAGILAMQLDAPIDRFMAASNANDVVPRYLKTGAYDPKSTIPTVANAMDVSDPSNFKRLLSFYDSHSKVVERILPFTANDPTIRKTIAKCYADHAYLLDPHSAIAYQGLLNKGGNGIFLGTAHYCKFLPVLQDALGEQIPVPEFAKPLMKKEKQTISIDADYQHLKDLLQAR